MNQEQLSPVQIIRRHNKWRRSDESLAMESPKAIGEALDSVCDAMDHHADEIMGWRDKWQCAVDMAARAQVDRDAYRIVVGELIAAIRVNAMRGTFATATVEDVDQWLKQWTDKLTLIPYTFRPVE